MKKKKHNRKRNMSTLYPNKCMHIELSFCFEKVLPQEKRRVRTKPKEATLKYETLKFAAGKHIQIEEIILMTILYDCLMNAVYSCAAYQIPKIKCVKPQKK